MSNEKSGTSKKNAEVTLKGHQMRQTSVVVQMVTETGAPIFLWWDPVGFIAKHWRISQWRVFVADHPVSVHL